VTAIRDLRPRGARFDPAAPEVAARAHAPATSGRRDGVTREKPREKLETLIGSM
jgi:hypothetical protein